MNNNQYYIRELSPGETITTYRNIAPFHFPKNELKPVASIEALYERNAYLGLGLFDTLKPSTHPLGYALFLTPPESDTVLLDYFAILEEYRDLGLGSFFLQEMKSFFHDKAGILIETEDPAYAPNKEEALLRNRRNAFYYKNGAHRTGVACTLFGVPFQIQFMPTEAPGTDSFSHPANLLATPFFRKNMETLYRFMLPEAVYCQNVIWR